MLASGWIREAGDANLDGAKKLLRRHNALRKLKKVRCDTHTHTHPRELRSLCRPLPTRPLFLSLTWPPLPPPKGRERNHRQAEARERAQGAPRSTGGRPRRSVRQKRAQTIYIFAARTLSSTLSTRTLAAQQLFHKTQLAISPSAGLLVAIDTQCTHRQCVVHSQIFMNIHSSTKRSSDDASDDASEAITQPLTPIGHAGLIQLFCPLKLF